MLIANLSRDGSPKNEHSHYFLTIMSFQICVAFFYGTWKILIFLLWIYGKSYILKIVSVY